jgi:hypothetical protein
MPVILAESDWPKWPRRVPINGGGRTATAWVVAIGIIGIGIAYVAKSETNPVIDGFGLPRLLERDERGWRQVKGVRNIASGLLGIFGSSEDLLGSE